MRTFKTSFLTILFLNLFVILGIAQSSSNLSPELVNALKTGNSIGLGSFFSEHIELAIQDKDAIYSKSQAVQIMAKFFREYPPVDFRLKHTGGHAGAMYVIGVLSTQSNSFRVNFLLKNFKGKSLIHQLHIELDNG